MLCGKGCLLLVAPRQTASFPPSTRPLTSVAGYTVWIAAQCVAWTMRESLIDDSLPPLSRAPSDGSGGINVVSSVCNRVGAERSCR